MLVIVSVRASKLFLFFFLARVRFVFFSDVHLDWCSKQSRPEVRFTARGGFLVVVGGPHGTLGHPHRGDAGRQTLQPSGCRRPPPPGRIPGVGLNWGWACPPRSVEVGFRAYPPPDLSHLTHRVQMVRVGILIRSIRASTTLLSIPH